MCAFCGCETRELIGSQYVVNCCDLGHAAICKKPETEVTITAGELSDIMDRLSNAEWQVERRNGIIEKLWKRRSAPRH